MLNAMAPCRLLGVWGKFLTPYSQILDEPVKHARTNTLAYFAAASVTKKGFITSTQAVDRATADGSLSVPKSGSKNKIQNNSDDV
jgi:hypothetical protein